MGDRAHLSLVAALALLATVVMIGTIGAGRATAAATGISSVGKTSNAAGPGLTTLGVTASTAGDAWIAVVKISSSTTGVSSVAGGGAQRWSRLKAYQDGGHDTELWLGTITSPGSSTMKVTYTADLRGADTDLVAQEFTTGLGAATSWMADVASGQTNTTSTIVSFPSLTPTHTSELYIG